MVDIDNTTFEDYLKTLIYNKENTEYTKEILLDLLGDTYGLIYEEPLRDDRLLELLNI